MADKEWASYEEVAVFLLNQFAERFGLGTVEGHTLIPAAGTTWNMDGIGYSQDGADFVIVECKRKTTRRVDQETVAGVAYRILKTGASGGIIVTPIGFQSGAMKVADFEGITRVTLNHDCTTTEYVLKFLSEIHVGLSDTVTLTESLAIEIRKADGTVIDHDTSPDPA